MTERLPSDHDAVASHRVHLERVGRSNRLRVPVPEPLDPEPGTVVRLSLGGEACHARVTETLDGAPTIAAARDNARLARAGEGPDRLAEWTAGHDLSPGDPVLIDVLTEGHAYGLRRPGERVVYTAPDAPDESLSRIARDLGE